MPSIIEKHGGGLQCAHQWAGHCFVCLCLARMAFAFQRQAELPLRFRHIVEADMLPRNWELLCSIFT